MKVSDYNSLQTQKTKLQSLIFVINARMESAQDAEDYEVIKAQLETAARVAGRIANSAWFKEKSR